MRAIVKTKQNRGFEVDLDTMESQRNEEFRIIGDHNLPVIDYNAYGFLRQKMEDLQKEIRVWKFHALSKIKLEVSE